MILESYKSIFYSQKNRKKIKCLNWESVPFYDQYVLILNLNARKSQKVGMRPCFPLFSIPSFNNCPYCPHVHGEWGEQVLAFWERNVVQFLPDKGFWLLIVPFLFSWCSKCCQLMKGLDCRQPSSALFYYKATLVNFCPSLLLWNSKMLFLYPIMLLAYCQLFN